MKYPGLSITILLILLFFSCGGKQSAENPEEEEIAAQTPVEVASITPGSVNDEITLFGNTLYLNRNMVTAPIPAFITRVNIRLGDKVQQGDVLYIIQSKESRALGNVLSDQDTELVNVGIIKVTAPAAGVISTLDKQQPGDYVMEGSQLCTISESQQLAFQINVPFEFTPYTRPGAHCTLILPDESRYPATFTRALTTMNQAAQTQSVLAKTSQSLSLPENLVVKALIQKGNQKDKQVLPRSCVLSNEMMTGFWVMKMVNDSLAVKVPITIGNRNSDQIEVLSPQFSPQDRIVSVGGYGLPDTALVSIQNQEAP
ncbi:MAG: HlyD family efflux transporter periplasmic adaptor subunit [Bacteroidia bacterium]|nr:HlyD family efflux transporter periplasmic adaptor subunit [Bacteroidia bacterium]